MEFLFLWLRGCLTKPFRTLSLCFRVTGKTSVFISHNNFVKKMSWKDATQSSFCLGVKECGTKCPHNFLFPKSSFRIQRTAVLRMFKDSAIILVAIRRSFFTSVSVDFGCPPLLSSSTRYLPSQNQEYHPKSLISSEPHSH
jgi:hypothetical protein